MSDILRYRSEDKFWKTEDIEGAWVRYDDHKKEIEKLKSEAKREAKKDIENKIVEIL